MWKTKKTCAKHLHTVDHTVDQVNFLNQLNRANDTALEESSVESPEVPSDLEDMVLEMAAKLDSSAAIPSIPA